MAFIIMGGAVELNSPWAAEDLFRQKEEQRVRVLDVVHEYAQVAQVVRVCAAQKQVVSALH